MYMCVVLVAVINCSFSLINLALIINSFDPGVCALIDKPADLYYFAHLFNNLHNLIKFGNTKFQKVLIKLQTNKKLGD